MISYNWVSVGHPYFPGNSENASKKRSGSMSLPLTLSKLKSVEEAIRLINSGQSVMVGGFGLSGHPLTLIDALLNTDVKELTVISNNLGEEGKGLGKWVRANRIRKAIGSYFTTNKESVLAWKNGEMEIELVPQGTFIERIRAGGAGIGGFYTTTAVGTEIANNKEEKIINGVKYILELGLRADVALIKAHKADELGNLTYYSTARNFNPAMATAADLVIAEVDEVVDVGELDPDQIITPHLYVDILVMNSNPSRGVNHGR
jgi:3-oxoacid CoA-transferase subunit A